MSSNTELESKLLKGSTIIVDNIKIRPLTLTEIIDDLGFDAYIRILSILGFDKVKFKDEIPEEEYNEIKNFDFFLAHEQLMDSFLEFLRVFLNYRDIFYIPEYQCVVFDCGNELSFMNRDNSKYNN